MDIAGYSLEDAHHLYARNSTLTSDSESRPAVYKIVGIILAISSGLFIGVSFVLKKKGLLRANAKYNEEAGEGYGYLRNWMWWTGMTLMIIGEICNFCAYAFVDAILVTPMGALAVVVTAILSAIFLKERLSFVGKVGCFNCIIGSVIIAIDAPEQSSVSTIQEMKKLVISPGFLSYAGVVILASAFVALWAGPRYGKKTMMVYISICSMVGGLSVVATQGLGAAIVAQIGGTPQFNQWFLYVLLVFVVATLLTEIIYLNKALNLFNAALVTPTYYVFFTSATIVTSAILFQGFHGTAASIATVIMGFLQICSGVVLLQLSKSAKDVPDAAVFSGDLDQVRTVAEQEEPEYEPRADTLRGGAAILRSFSTARQRREAEEAKTLHSESLEPIGENEYVEWDGLRRRKTVLEPGRSQIQRRKTVHPPLGMSHFPEPSDTESDRDSADDVHPGFFSRLSTRRRKRHPEHSSTHPVPLETIDASPIKLAGSSDDVLAHDYGDDSAPREHVYGLPPGLRVDGGGDHDHDAQDTSYHSPGQRLQWADRTNTPTSTTSSSLAPPRPPLHSTGSSSKRQFSFQNVFSRSSSSRPGSGADAGGPGSPIRPLSARSGLSFAGRKTASRGGGGAETEEERLGLVKGDSALKAGALGSTAAAAAAAGGRGRYTDDDEEEDNDDGGADGRGAYGSAPSYASDDEWVLPSVGGASGSRNSGSGSSGSGNGNGNGGSGHGHSRSLTGGGLSAAPNDIRIPGAAPGGGSALAMGPAGARGSAGSAGSAGSGGYGLVRRASEDSDDSYDEAVAGKM